MEIRGPAHRGQCPHALLHRPYPSPARRGERGLADRGAGLSPAPARLPLPLSAWLALRGTGRGGDPAEEPAPRPAGRLVWLHAEGAEAGAALAAFTAHLEHRGAAPALVVTGDAPQAEGLHAAAPPDNRSAARAFLDRWRPDALVWFGAPARPALIAEAALSGMPRLLVPSGSPVVPRRRGAGFGAGLGLARSLLKLFDCVLAEERGQIAELLRSGAREARAIGALVPPPHILPCSRAELESVTEAIGPRPVWLAAAAPVAELAALTLAQRRATRATHRLLLAVLPADPADSAAFARAFRAEGLRVADRAQGQEPGEETDICLADGVSELGLWYRIATLTYLGGTMSRGGGRHPFEPAAMGSAVLHGIRTEPHDAAYRRLARAGAARAVTSGEDLGRMVETLLTPDKAAQMAHAAWSVTSQGAEALDRLAEHLLAILPAEAP
ncbi:3-deoxy-D-manno-octulosonic acid transferase [Pseudoroseicyclus sp. CXY001]|uniref:3-deoxy-D-manno-octulosonic acid transferase n=1 Tax=Pseudoroseicyclus sp. CXY001 TaxID=3242492 RepID=UPI003570A0E1